MDRWVSGGPLEQRAAVAAVCEPRLLVDPDAVRATLTLLDRATASLVEPGGKNAPDVKVLRQALGYCWSVAVAADPVAGKPVMERWLAIDHPDVRWVMRENLRKSRLIRVDPVWVNQSVTRLERT
jgi:hypothetical protein